MLKAKNVCNIQQYTPSTVETVADYQGVVVARTILPGEAESAVLSTKHKLLGDIRGYW